jgi:Domain of unknown function (DUF397)
MEDNLDPCWRKASYSGNGGGSCVEVGRAPRAVLVRDTTDRDGGTLAFNVKAWRAFTVKIGSGN